LKPHGRPSSITRLQQRYIRIGDSRGLEMLLAKGASGASERDKEFAGGLRGVNRWEQRWTSGGPPSRSSSQFPPSAVRFASCDDLPTAGMHHYTATATVSAECNITPSTRSVQICSKWNYARPSCGTTGRCENNITPALTAPDLNSPRMSHYVAPSHPQI
jgi:hypothetical protein